MAGLANRCIRKPAYPKVSPPLPPIGGQEVDGQKKAAKRRVSAAYIRVAKPGRFFFRDRSRIV